MQSSPWLERKQWRSATLATGTRGGIIALTIFTVIWNTFSHSVVWLNFNVIMDEVSLNQAALAIFLFPLVGVLLLALCIHLWIGWLKFGKTPLTLDPYPGAIGGDVGGTIETAIPFASSQHFEVTLELVYHYTTGSGDDRKTQESVKWRTEGYCNTSASARGTRLQFRFEVPEGLHESAAKRGSAYHYWRVSVKAKLDGPDFSRNWDIPVYPTAEKSRALHGVDSLRHERAQAAAEERIEQLARIRHLADGIEFFFPPFRNLRGAFFVLCFGSVFAGVGWFAISMSGKDFIAVIFGIIFGGVGCLIIAAGFYAALYGLKIHIGPRGIVLTRYLAFYAFKKHYIKKPEIEAIDCGQNTTSHVKVLLKNGHKHSLAKGLSKRAEAELLAETYRGYLGL